MLEIQGYSNHLEYIMCLRKSSTGRTSYGAGLVIYTLCSWVQCVHILYTVDLSPSRCFIAVLSLSKELFSWLFYMKHPGPNEAGLAKHQEFTAKYPYVQSWWRTLFIPVVLLRHYSTMKRIIQSFGIILKYLESFGACKLTLKVLNFWKLTSYCSLKPLWSGMGEEVPARTSPTLHPHPLPLCSNCRN